MRRPTPHLYKLRPRLFFAPQAYDETAMINIFVTYRCNLSCPYCFARDLKEEFPLDMGEETFSTLLDWLVRGGVPAAAFIGGEPTLHPHLASMIERTAEAGISTVLFTNGLFESSLVDDIAPYVSNVVVNFNEPQTYAPGQWKRLNDNLMALRVHDVRITFSKNFSRRFSRYDYLLEGIESHNVSAVRYDISRPAVSGTNDHFTLDDTWQVISTIVGFVKQCEALGVRTGLDCSVRFCDMRSEDRQYLERVSAKFTGICHPSLDVHPDLSASYCLPLNGVRIPDVLRFRNHEELLWHFAQMVRPLRLKNVSADCLDCKDFMRRCQGGCLALRHSADADGHTIASHKTDAVPDAVNAHNESPASEQNLEFSENTCNE